MFPQVTKGAFWRAFPERPEGTGMDSSEPQLFRKHGATLVQKNNRRSLTSDQPCPYLLRVSGEGMAMTRVRNGPVELKSLTVIVFP